MKNKIRTEYFNLFLFFSLINFVLYSLFNWSTSGSCIHTTYTNLYYCCCFINILLLLLHTKPTYYLQMITLFSFLPFDYGTYGTAYCDIWCTCGVSLKRKTISYSYYFFFSVVFTLFNFLLFCPFPCVLCTLCDLLSAKLKINI